jgi:uncharacterized membrane protein
MQAVFNFLLLVAIGYLLLRVRSLQDQLEQLKAMLRRTSAPNDAGPRLESIARASTEQAPTPLPKPIPSKRSLADWEFLIGGNVFSRLGALAIVISAGFALNYAFERNLITESVRILMGFIAGFLFLAGAEWSHRRRLSVFSQALVAVGVSTHYMTIYAMSQFYRMVPDGLAMGLMVVVALGTVGLALYYASQPLAIMASVGAYLVPVLFSSDSATAIPLLVYLLVISIAFSGLIWYKASWIPLRIFPIAGVLMLTMVWYARQNMEFLVLELLFLGLLWLLFVSYDLWNHLLHTQRKSVLDPWITVLTGCFTFVGVISFMELRVDWTESILPASMATLYTALVMGLHDRVEPGSIIPNIWSLIVGVLSLFALYAISDEYLGAALVAAVMLGFMFLRERANQAPLIWAFGVLLVFNTLITIFLGTNTPQPDWLILNSRTLAYVLMITGWLWLGFSAKGIPFLTESFRMRMGGIAAIALGFVWLNVEVETGFSRAFPMDLITGAATIPSKTLDNWIELTRSTAWLFYSVLLFTVGVIRSSAAPRYGAILIFGMSILKIFISDLSFLDTPYRIISFLALGLILLAVSFVYQRYRAFLFGK